jgi:hypothetical protein
MSVPGNSILIIALLAIFVACSGYAAGRIQQRRRTGRDREAAYRDGYETASRSVFSLAARVIGPRRSGVRASAAVKRDGREGPGSVPRSEPLPPAVPAATAPSSSAPPSITPPAPGPAISTSAPPVPVPAPTVPAPTVPAPTVVPASPVAPASNSSPSSFWSAADSVVVSPGGSAVFPVPPAPVGSEARTSGSAVAGLGFPVPVPPPSGTVPEPAAVGGVSYQPFPDPRGVGETTVLPDLRDLIGGLDAASGRRVPQPSRPTSPASGLAFAPATSVSPTRAESADSADPPTGAGRASSDEDVAISKSDVSAGAGGAIPSAGVGSGDSADESSNGLRHSATEDGAGVVRDVFGVGGRSELGGNRRNLRRAAGHRAPEGDDDTVGVEGFAVSDTTPSGRHTVPDELVRASTYRLPPDRVFRAKVRDADTPPDDPTTRLVPKPRQS